jgi:hypothetical protein
MPLMVRCGRAQLLQFVMSAGYLGVAGTAAWIGWRAEHHGVMPYIAAGVTLLGATLAWRLSHRRYHLIADTPTSLIRSASQGYVELVGRASLLPGQQPLAFNGLPPCVWFEVVVSEPNTLDPTSGNTWSRTSDELFALRDDSGLCVIDPDHCEVHGTHERQWKLEGTRYRARYLAQHDPLYALGELSTQRASEGHGDFRADVADQLRQWKRKPREMLRRFDANGDGTVDHDEYVDAVKAAEVAVREQMKSLHSHPDVHLLRNPGSGFPYILSNTDPQAVAVRFRRWAIFHALLAMAAAAALITLIAR